MTPEQRDFSAFTQYLVDAGLFAGMTEIAHKHGVSLRDLWEFGGGKSIAMARREVIDWLKQAFSKSDSEVAKVLQRHPSYAANMRKSKTRRRRERRSEAVSGDHRGVPGEDGARQDGARQDGR
jgi:hypothetical protein